MVRKRKSIADRYVNLPHSVRKRTDRAVKAGVKASKAAKNFKNSDRVKRSSERGKKRIKKFLTGKD